MSQSTIARARGTSGPAAALSLADGVRLATAGRLDEAQACFEQILAREPQNADVCNNLAVLHARRKNFAAAAQMFERASRLNPHDAEIRLHNARANLMHGIALSQQHRYHEAVTNYRRALRCEPGNAVALANLTDALARTGGRGQRSDFVPDPATPACTHVLIACMPKSGSSFLKAALHALTGWPEAGFCFAYFQNEQDLYLPNLLAVDQFDTVTQQHCRATLANILLLQGFDIRPIVLVRNLPDIVMSLVDYYDSGAIDNTFFAEGWPALSADAKRDVVVDHVMPWYVAFYASWQRAVAANRLECLFVRFEDMIVDKAGTLGRVNDFLGLGKTAGDCRAAVVEAEGDPAKTRFNRGVAGRGATMLTEDQQARLRRLTVPYPAIDFSPVGI